MFDSIERNYIVTSVREGIYNPPGIAKILFPTLEAAKQYVEINEGVALDWEEDTTLDGEWFARNDGELFIIAEVISE